MVSFLQCLWHRICFVGREQFTDILVPISRRNKIDLLNRFWFRFWGLAVY